MTDTLPNAAGGAVIDRVTDVVLVRLRGGRIARFGEYIDRADRLSLAEGRINVPGLAPRA